MRNNCFDEFNDSAMKDVIISISGVQDFPISNNEPIELITEGKYRYKDGIAKISYCESELTGLDGTTTSFTLMPHEVVLRRTGSENSQMVFHEGKKSTFLYTSSDGSSTVGLDTHRIHSTLGPDGGDMEIDYLLDYNQAFLGRNKFKISVRERRDSGENV
ncbi:MAG: DUF1934 domain-containing protein [Candidatus Scatomorpha sp.]|jgi:uncharacterized beta-barrel protein YwiB (DUF1934 family)